MTRQELQKALIDKGVAPDVAKAAANRANQNGNTDLTTAQIDQLAVDLENASAGSVAEQNDSAFQNKFVVPAVDRVVPKLEGTKTGEGAAKQAEDKAKGEDAKLVETLTQSLLDQSAQLGLEKTEDELRKLAKKQIEATGGNFEAAERAAGVEIGLEKQALEFFRQKTGREVSRSQLDRAIDRYNSRVRSGQDKIDPNDLSDAMNRYGNDALFTNVMNAATRSTSTQLKYSITDALGREHSLDADLVANYQKAFGMSVEGGGFSTALADAYSEWDRKATAGLKDRAEFGWEVLAPFISDSLRSYEPEDDPDGYATLDAMLDSQSSVERYRANLAAFGESNPLAALVGTMDEELAAKMVTVGITDDEVFKVARMLKGVDPQQLGLVGDAIERYTEAYKKRAGGGGGREIVLPDRNKIAEGFRELYRSWFKVDPSEAELEGLINETTAQFVAAQQSNTSPDLASDMIARTRQTDLYQRLFANKTGGASEEEYVGQFEGAARQLLGGEIANPGAIQAGMETGQIGTTVGAVAGSQQAFNNSTFRDRLAQAAQAISRLT